MSSPFSRLLLLAGIAWTIAAHAGPVLVLTKPEIDMGEMPQRTKTDTIVSIRNTGDEDLVIAEVKTSCGCTAAMLDRDTIPPGEASDLKITFDSRHYEGLKRRQLWIMSNDPEHPRTVLTLTMTIIPDMKIEPANVDFGIVPIGETPSRIITILNNRGGNLPELGKLVYDRERLEVSTTGGGERPLTVIAKMRPGMPPGRVNQVIIVDWADDARDDTTIDVFGQIKAPIVITPDSLYISGNTTEQLERPRRVVVKSPEGETFRVVTVEGLPDWLTATLVPQQGEPYQTIEFVASAIKAPGQFRGTINVKIDHATVTDYPISLRLFKVQVNE